MVTTNQKSTIHTHTHKRKSNPNTTLKIAIKSQEKRTKEEGKNLQPRLLYPARISFRFDREIKPLQTSKS